MYMYKLPYPIGYVYPPPCLHVHVSQCLTLYFLLTQCFFTYLQMRSLVDDYIQMRSLVDDGIHLLPQWSEPISLTLSTLPPPEINSSSLLSISVTSPSNSDSFSVSTTVELSWEEPEETDDLEMYEVWVGSRSLREFEQPEESEEFGSVLQFQVYYAVRTVVRALSHAQVIEGFQLPITCAHAQCVGYLEQLNVELYWLWKYMAASYQSCIYTLLDLQLS